MNNAANNGKPMYRLGFDARSASLVAVLMDENNRVVEKGYCLHHGDMRRAFCGLLENMLRRAGDAVLCRALPAGAAFLPRQTLSICTRAARRSKISC
jgi:activator of 2-hydroxyglutaryl-CoA dehydratase